ncbi:tetratricopeptide repeat protein [Methanothermobacter tenebrarum]|uniref:tetratricopeptide repeat protein n=1 Tax=Methanothermobacter tenebrarum TaxID=680118 RepID=UPI0037448EFD
MNKAMELDPENSNIWLSKATVYYKLGNYQEAIKCCDKTIELSDRDEDVASALYYKGVVLADTGASEEAIKCFEKVLEIIPPDPFAQEKILKGD